MPVILSGDFNAEPDSEEMKPLRETAGLVIEMSRRKHEKSDGTGRD